MQKGNYEGWLEVHYPDGSGNLDQLVNATLDYAGIVLRRIPT
jgi:hypothetical protein